MDNDILKRRIPSRNISNKKSIEFLESVVLRYQGDKCLIWPFSSADGKATVFINPKNVYVSRIACEVENGPAPTPRHHAAHECGMAHFGCVSRRHLSWKTPSQNQMDRVKHGTSNRGEGHGNCKLTQEQALYIRYSSDDLSVKAARCGISRRYARQIEKGDRWGWL